MRRNGKVFTRHGIIEALESRRLLSAGQLDTSFGTGGKTFVDFHGATVAVQAVATQGDGKTVLAGYEFNSHSGTDAVVVRLNFDGSLDKTFGPSHTGIVTAHVGDSNHRTELTAVATGPNDTIVVGGSDNADSVGSNGNFLVMRFTSNGALDSTFGAGGKKVLGFGLFSMDSQVTALAVQTDGKIVLVGNEETTLFAKFEFAMMRLKPNGTLDSTFNGDGTKTIDFDHPAFGTAVAIDYTRTAKTNPHFGTIVVSGYTDNDDFQKATFAAIRVTPGGKLDASFHGNGQIVLTPPHSSFAQSTSVVIQSNGSIVLAGSAAPVSAAGLPTGSSFEMTRLTPSGMMDTSFAGHKGWAIARFGSKDTDLASSLLLGPNDRLIVGGDAIAGNGSEKMALASFTSDGLLDSSFGAGGLVNTGITRGDFSMPAMAYLGDRIVITGGGRFDTARYLDTNPNVAVTAINTTAKEQGPTPVTFLVTRDQRLPYPTRVFFTIGGTATSPTLFAVRTHNNDYFLSGMTLPSAVQVGPSFTPFVDIPADQTLTLVTLTPTDDTRAEGTETASFSINPDPLYNISTPKQATLNILDNDSQASKTINPTADTYIQDGASADTNFGTSTQLLVKKSGTTGQNRETYLKFDLSSMSSFNTVKLNLFGALNNSDQPSLVTQVFSIADNSWAETGITWNKRRTPGASPLASATITGTTPMLYSFDVTAYIKAQLSAGNKTVSFVLINAASTSPAAIFNSREAGSNKPTLVVT
jgi:uncharacterized delta-60 repeat protein